MHQVCSERQISGFETVTADGQQLERRAAVGVVAMGSPAEHAELRHDTFLWKIFVERLHQATDPLTRQEVETIGACNLQRGTPLDPLNIPGAVENDQHKLLGLRVHADRSFRPRAAAFLRASMFFQPESPERATTSPRTPSSRAVASAALTTPPVCSPTNIPRSRKAIIPSTASVKWILTCLSKNPPSKPFRINGVM